MVALSDLENPLELRRQTSTMGARPSRFSTRLIYLPLTA
jgi:hypothetical protein